MSRGSPGGRLALRTAALGLAVVLAAPAVGAAASSATKQIERNWAAFFSGKTPATKKIALLEDGAEFARIIKAQAASPLSKGVSADVSAVKLVSRSSATVRYTIFEDGAPALKHQTGTAVLQGGTWKVGDTSFCALLRLEGTKAAACPAKR